MYNLKITCIMPYRGNNIKTVSLSPCKIVNFHKIALICTCENIYVNSTCRSSDGKYTWDRLYYMPVTSLQTSWMPDMHIRKILAAL